ncbi:type II secretion system F family protein [Candidatus Nomurabacteria bacterium]|nr:type II secretion system F family protein [Candidatus Nomurabacteria bacterium]USN94498.1 MAG: type II secretion system F family protein [Candidatus Nomurabacteria bacterium]
MNFKYKAIDQTGKTKEGIVEAINKDLAIQALQKRGLIVSGIKSEEEKNVLELSIYEHVPLKDIVIVSRQIATLFEAQVSALKAFSLLSGTAKNTLLRNTLNKIVDDLQAGYQISGALEKHPRIFSNFYVNMVRAGEESGKLSDTFLFLADYLERQYALTTKTRNALIYPAFVIFTFIVVMVLMFTAVIPKLSEIIKESGQDIPLYTKAVIGISDFFVNYGIFVLFIVIIGGLWLFRLTRTQAGKKYLDNVKLQFPILGGLFRKLYLARISDNLETMLSSGIPIVRSLEVTAEVVGNKVYEAIMKNAVVEVKGGNSLSKSLEGEEFIPEIMVQMVQVGEETGSIGQILKTMSRFYRREVDDAVDTIVGLIEPIMIVFLGLAVGVLLTSVLVPIYNIASGIA